MGGEEIFSQLLAAENDQAREARLRRMKRKNLQALIKHLLSSLDELDSEIRETVLAEAITELTVRFLLKDKPPAKKIL